MESKDRHRPTTGNALGTVMILTWFLVLGPLGVVLLGGTAYFLVAENTAVAILWCALFFVPVLLTLVWGAVMLREVLRERRLQNAPFVFLPEAIESPSQRLQTGYS